MDTDQILKGKKLIFKILKSSGSEVKASASNVGDPGSIPGSGRSPGEGNGNPLQYSCLENPIDGEAQQVIVHGVTKSQTRLSDFTFKDEKPRIEVRLSKLQCKKHKTKSITKIKNTYIWNLFFKKQDFFLESLQQAIKMKS